MAEMSYVLVRRQRRETQLRTIRNFFRVRLPRPTPFKLATNLCRAFIFCIIRTRELKKKKKKEKKGNEVEQKMEAASHESIAAAAKNG